MIVDLYVYASHEVALWENIWRALRHRGVDVHYVVEPPGSNRARGTASDSENNWHDDKDDGAVVELMDDAMFAHTCAALSARGIKWIEASRVEADVAVTTAGSGWLMHYRGKRVRTMYGVGAVTDSYGHGAINDGMDAVLVHGPFSRNAIMSRNRQIDVFDVGFPKWASVFTGGLDRAAARAELGLQEDGRTLVAWLPTWAQNSSIDRFSPALTGLARDHRIIAKPHHNNLRFERARLAGIDRQIEVLDGLDSLVPLVMAADVVVGDVRSGGVTEALLADRPVVGLVPSGDLREQRLLSGVDEAIIPCERSDDLRAALDTALASSAQAARSRWARWFFGEVRDDGTCAAEAIINVGRTHRRTPSLDVDIDELDEHLDAYRQGRSTVDAAQLITLLWPSWPGDPRLLDLLDEVWRSASVSSVIACARHVRVHGHVERCPVLALAGDRSQPSDRRLGAAAAGSVFFDDTECTELFLDLCSDLDEQDLEACLVMLLTIEPSVVPAYVASVAAAGHHDALVALLRSVGVEADELDALLTAA